MLIEQSKDYAEGVFVDYLRENDMLKQQIHTKPCNLSESEKDLILKKFKL